VYGGRDNMQDFLKSSPVARDVSLKTNVVLHRRKMNAAELLSLDEEGSLTVRENGELYELDVNGLAVAKGVIIKKHGEYFFKVKEMFGEV
jgi:flagellar motor switch/type III secretory pathway protein FliN